MPGVKEEDIDLSIKQDMLTIRAEKRLETEGENDTRHVKERMYGTLQRSLWLQQPIDPEQVRAHFDRGVLTVIIPHEGEQHRHHRIAIDRGAPPSTQSPAWKDAETQH
ncbi:Hsp20/alpha crystallin family protein [Novosphingobium sp.]|uniref:Hsp20/alpha crystallin family protein n=1 Tax=Novosphingobium sp. TaxID=1874826 RepID=UPI002B45F5B1|nr:Hsp20/alpha crystallin family protein [Novosphingobium sp.]HKR90766.1 Hsp20/alpha crystallin family protein [Novosphingobium sp.]